MNYRLITAYLLLQVNYDKIMNARWDFDTSSARTRRVSALDKHQNWSASALFCHNSCAESKYAVVNLIHTRHVKLVSLYMWKIRHFIKFKKLSNITNKIHLGLPVKQINQSYLHVNIPNAYTHTRVRCLECNWTKIMHARYFRVFWVLSIQIGYSMCIVYAECMNSISIQPS